MNSILTFSSTYLPTLLIWAHTLQIRSEKRNTQEIKLCKVVYLWAMRREWLSVSVEQCFNLMAVPSGEIKPLSHYKTRMLTQRQALDFTCLCYQRIFSLNYSANLNMKIIIITITVSPSPQI